MIPILHGALVHPALSDESFTDDLCPSQYLRKVSVRGHRVFLVFAVLLLWPSPSSLPRFRSMTTSFYRRALPASSLLLTGNLPSSSSSSSSSIGISLQVPLSVGVVWAYAFFLTAGGAYRHDGCNPGVPTSNILLDSCRNHALAMRSCRTDVSDALRAAAWVRVPYPLQWGMPSFSFRTSFIMFFVALVASVDSVRLPPRSLISLPAFLFRRRDWPLRLFRPVLQVGSYHAASVLIGSSPPTPGIVSRGIGLEGCSSILAGLWGTGTGSTTLTENIHTIDATRMASRRALEVGAAFLILFSFVGTTDLRHLLLPARRISEHSLIEVSPLLFLSGRWGREGGGLAGVDPSGPGCGCAVLYVGSDRGAGPLDAAIHPGRELQEYDNRRVHPVHLPLRPFILAAVPTHLPPHPSRLSPPLRGGVKRPRPPRQPLGEYSLSLSLSRRPSSSSKDLSGDC